MHTYSVGSPYAPGRTSWPETTQYNYRGGEHELVFFWARPSAAEVDAARAGRLDAAVLYERPVLYLLYRLQGACDWSDAPYSIHLVPAEQRSPPPATAPKRTLLHVILVDAATGIIGALRAVSMSADFARVIYANIRDQLAQPFDAAAYDRAIAATYARHAGVAGSAGMLDRAVVTEVLGMV